ncbi:MAG: YicC family protein [Deltaproteobacteria bacterium]|nr:YicC family protein [Deltaproteobacteria bacterium]
MPKSMTGYGRGECVLEGRRVQVEVRSYNHRHLDVSLRLPRRYLPFEAQARQQVQAICARGRVELALLVEGAATEVAELELNRPLVTAYLAALRQLKQQFRLRGRIDLPLVAGIKDLITVKEADSSAEEEWGRVQRAVQEALEALDAMREKEGRALVADLEARMATVGALMMEVHARAPVVQAEYRARLQERIREAVPQGTLDEWRLSQEVAYFADRSDITEELVRFASHVEQFLKVLRTESPVGRKLDFLLQEMNREVNTVGSKGSDTLISQRVVEIKTELEKVREQVQNLE